MVEEQLIEQVLKQMNRLIIGERGKYLEQVKEGKQTQYITISRKLTDKAVKEHLRGERTIGVFYCGGGSKFLCWDIDDCRKRKTLSIIKVLIEIGIPKEHIHVEASGNKGYHIWIFIDEVVPRIRLVQFGVWVINQIQGDRSKIEIRPENVDSGKGIKLPLGIHRRTKKPTLFVDHKLKPLEDPFSYFLSIQPIPKATLYDVLEQIKDRYYELPKEFAPIQNNFGTVRNIARRLIDNGMINEDLSGDNRRHYYQFFVALHYKELGLAEEEVYKKVLEWALKEKYEGRADSSKAHIEKDVKRDVHYIFKKDKHFYETIRRKLRIYQNDIELLKRYTDERVRKVLWCILLLGRMFHKDGKFYFSYRKIISMTGVPQSSVWRSVHRLLDDGIIQIVKKGNYGNMKASTYYVPHLTESSEVSDIDFIEETFTSLFEETYRIANSIDDSKMFPA